MIYLALSFLFYMGTLHDRVIQDLYLSTDGLGQYVKFNHERFRFTRTYALLRKPLDSDVYLLISITFVALSFEGQTPGVTCAMAVSTAWSDLCRGVKQTSAALLYSIGRTELSLLTISRLRGSLGTYSIFVHT